MMKRVAEGRAFDTFDLRYVGLILVLLGIGVLSIHSATHTQAVGAVPYYLKQLVWIGIGAVAFVVLWAWDYHAIARLAYPAYALVLLLLVFVLFEGRMSKGAQRWIALGPFSFQPSEFAKLVLVVV
ncbi:MAG: FtsW/RodA/SpoVE family cell cycle protein, partial [Nitrospira sp.]